MKFATVRHEKVAVHLCGLMFFALAADAGLCHGDTPVAGIHRSVNLIDEVTSWRYHAGSDGLPVNWMQPGYDDSHWGEGVAPLGYDDPEARRGISMRYGPSLRRGTGDLARDKADYYFRKEFDFDPDGALEGWQLRFEPVLRGGLVVYLNGEEIGRSDNLPGGVIGPGTVTTAALETRPELFADFLIVDPNMLLPGRNLLAVSLHNSEPPSGAVYFMGRLVLEDGRMPPGLLLTWQRDPTTTMTIDWHRRGRDAAEPPVIEVRPRGDDEWRAVEAERMPFPFSDRIVDRIELVGLEPGSEYEFRSSGSRVFYFRTMPAHLERPLRFAQGGDTLHGRELMEMTNRAAMEHDPEFVVWGGDFAYADGWHRHTWRWFMWFDINMNTLIADDGRVVPIIGGIGNHEVWQGYHNDRMVDDEARLQFAPFFFTFFAFPGLPGYNVLDFGDYLTLIALDSDHANPIAGEQTEWLDGVLRERRNFKHVLPFYHVPAFPSTKDFETASGGRSRLIRDHWVPLFEYHGVRVAFEHHDHAYKRTHPIREGKIDPAGVVYLGDGSWGVGARQIYQPDAWYFAKTLGGVQHAIIVTLYPDRQEYLMIDGEGNVFDELTIRLD